MLCERLHYIPPKRNSTVLDEDINNVLKKVMLRQAIHTQNRKHG